VAPPELRPAREGGTTLRTRRQQARLAGILYLILGLIAPIGLMYVPGQVIVRGDATATADRLRAQEGLVRLGLASELVHQVMIIFVVLALYRLFEPVDEYRAKELVVLGALVSVPIVFLNSLNWIAALVLSRGAPWLAPFEAAELDALAYLFLRLHGQGITIASVFWGLWLFPFGILVVKSGFLPKLLGYLLFAAGTGYLLNAVATLFLPAFSASVSPIAMALYFGEVPIIFWLAIRGAKPEAGE
jgi:hypothetical protein